jgi:hypothetical protein
MEMEHRFGNRRAIRAPVVLHPRGGRPLSTSTRDVSISGMFVEATPAPFSANSVIDVELTLPGVAGLHTYRWQAMVIRSTASGIGLMFDRLRPPAITRLLASIDTGLSSVAAPEAGTDKVVALRPVNTETQIRP